MFTNHSIQINLCNINVKQHFTIVEAIFKTKESFNNS